MKAPLVIYAAMRVAVDALGGLLDATWYPLVLHSMRVMHYALRYGLSPVEAAAAVLHDVWEDADVSATEVQHRLVRMGVEVEEAMEVARLVDVLTHRNGERRTAYMDRVVADRSASRVKVMDVLDNTQPERMDFDTPNGLARRRRKYREARDALQEVVPTLVRETGLDAL